MTDLQELQGEVLAFRCFLAALVSVLPLGVQIRVMPTFEIQASLLRRSLTAESLVGFDRAAGAVRVKQPPCLGWQKREATPP